MSRIGQKLIHRFTVQCCKQRRRARATLLSVRFAGYAAIFV